jgi:hypothetical protein
MKLANKGRVVPIRPARPEDVVTDTIIFEVGGDRFAIDWSAEIRPLPPAPAQVLALPRVPRKDKTNPQKRSNTK